MLGGWDSIVGSDWATGCPFVGMEKYASYIK
jgi:hypothetical protein